MAHDENKLNNNHAVLLVNEEIGLIEMFYEIQSKQYAVVQLLKKEYFDFKIHMVNSDVKDALLKINDCFSFCNITNDRKLILVNDIKEKILLIKSNINPKSSFFATKIVVKHS
jgi:hypothetical protein